jgi:hypothetical protein
LVPLKRHGEWRGDWNRALVKLRHRLLAVAEGGDVAGIDVRRARVASLPALDVRNVSVERKLILDVRPNCQTSEYMPPEILPDPVPAIVMLPCQFFTPRNSSSEKHGAASARKAIDAVFETLIRPSSHILEY